MSERRDPEVDAGPIGGLIVTLLALIVLLMI